MNGFVLFGDGCGHTQVPNIFLDKYMPGANGEYVKIYLYLLRCLSSDTQELSVTLIADKFDRTEGDVDRALRYWEKMHLLKLEYDADKNLTGVRLLDGTETECPGTEVPARAQEGLSDDDFRQLVFVCEQYLGRPLSSTEVEKITAVHDSLGFPPELIEYLVEYCVSGGHKSMRYIEATAAAWKEAGITTLDDARQRTSVYNSAYFKILKSFGITGRGPVEAEIRYMDKWLHEEHFPLELVTEACNRTVAQISRPSFAYADKILSSWKASGVQKTEDLDRVLKKSGARGDGRQAGSEGQNRPRQSSPDKFHNFSERDYDYGQLEKALVNK